MNRSSSFCLLWLSAFENLNRHRAISGFDRWGLLDAFLWWDRLFYLLILLNFWRHPEWPMNVCKEVSVLKLRHLFIQTLLTKDIAFFRKEVAENGWVDLRPTLSHCGSLLRRYSKERVSATWIYWRIEDGITGNSFEAFDQNVLILVITMLGKAFNSEVLHFDKNWLGKDVFC
jgi:hypothetical protein